MADRENGPHETRRIRWRFGIRHLLLLALAIGIAIAGYHWWTGPTLEQRMLRAEQQGDTRMFSFWVLLGADVDLKMGDRSVFSTPMVRAARSGDLERVKLYVEHGANLDHRVMALPKSRHDPDRNFTAITLAAREGNWEVVRYLNRAGADAEFRDANGFTARDFAIRARRFDIARELESGDRSD